VTLSVCLANGKGCDGGMRAFAFKGSGLILTLALLALCSGCGSIQPQVSFKPIFLPVQLNVSSSGVSVQGDTSLATPVGTISIGAEDDLASPPDGTLYVILRDHRTGTDRVWDIRTGNEQFTAVVNGTTSITVTNSEVVIDVTHGRIKKVRFRRFNEALPGTRHQSWLAAKGQIMGQRWHEGYSRSWYKPFMLCSWAYDDSTITKWYGIGFIWFLIRLVLAAVLFFIDLIFTIFFLIGQLVFMIFGPSIWPGGLG
jgi:hypothetical protein